MPRRPATSVEHVARELDRALAQGGTVALPDVRAALAVALGGVSERTVTRYVLRTVAERSDRFEIVRVRRGVAEAAITIRRRRRAR